MQLGSCPDLALLVRILGNLPFSRTHEPMNIPKIYGGLSIQLCYFSSILDLWKFGLCLSHWSQVAFSVHNH